MTRIHHVNLTVPPGRSQPIAALVFDFPVLPVRSLSRSALRLVTADLLPVSVRDGFGLEPSRRESEPGSPQSRATTECPKKAGAGLVPGYIRTN